MRYSAQREKVLQVLKETTCHPDADWIYSEVKKSMPDVSLGTIYRNLRLLEQEGELITLNVGDEKVHYDGRTTDHAHFKCDRCRKITDVFLPDTAIQSLIDRGYAVSTVSRVYTGVCPDCNKTEIIIH